MRKDFIAAASALLLSSALMTGGAYAQGEGGRDMLPNQPSTLGTSSSSIPDLSASAERMMGKTVIGADGQEIGEVEDVIFDASTGKARQLVISSGGFLGIGAKQVAIDVNDAQFDTSGDQLEVTTLNRQDVETMDDFEYSGGMTSLGRGHGGTQE